MKPPMYGKTENRFQDSPDLTRVMPRYVCNRAVGSSFDNIHNSSDPKRSKSVHENYVSSSYATIKTGITKDLSVGARSEVSKESSTTAFNVQRGAED